MSSDEMRHESVQALQATGGGPAVELSQESTRTEAPVDDPHITEVVSSLGLIEAVVETAIPGPERLGTTAPVEATIAPEHSLAASAIVIDTDSLEGPASPVEMSAASATVPPPAASTMAEQSAAPPAAAPPTTEPTPAPSEAEPAPPEPAPPEPETAAAPPAEAPPRRVRLNPIVNESEVRPVPTLGGTDQAIETPAPVSEAAAFEATAASAAPPEVSEKPEVVAAPSAEPGPPASFAAAAPVELPAREQPLSAELEAEIEAALAGQQLAPPPPPPPPAPAAEGEEAPAAEPSPERPAEEDLTQGTRLTGRVQSIHGDDVFLDLGYRAPGVVSVRQFESGKQPEIGQQFQVVVDRIDPEGLIHVNLPRGRRRISGNWDAVSAGQVVDCMVTGVNKGGLEVTVSNLRGFLPASQVDLRFVSDLQQFVGQKLTVQIVEANPKKRNLVVSRRNYLVAERQEAEETLWKTLATGQVFRGTVKTIKDYGAFVDIGGVDGFLHVGEMSWNRLRHPSDVLAEGQEVEVQVISLDPDKKRIGLGMKQLVANPWQLAADKYAPGKTVSGRVTRTADFGAFVELEPGVEGLVHISELDHQRVRRVTDVLQEGQTVDVQVLEVIPDRKRISLSLKALKEKPADERPPADEDLAPGGEEYTRRRRGPLKGGTGGASRGGLFGDPNRFT